MIITDEIGALRARAEAAEEALRLKILDEEIVAHAPSAWMCLAADEARVVLTAEEADAMRATGTWTIKPLYEAAPLPDTHLLNAMLHDRGMFTVDRLAWPANPFALYAGMDNLDAFGGMIERRAREYAIMLARRTLHPKPDDDPEMLPWLQAKAAAFRDIHTNFKASILEPQPPLVSTADLDDEPELG